MCLFVQQVRVGGWYVVYEHNILYFGVQSLDNISESLSDFPVKISFFCLHSWPFPNLFFVDCLKQRVRESV